MPVSNLSGGLFWPQANLVGRGTVLLKMYIALHARKHTEGFVEGICSRKVCGSFAADMFFVCFIFQCVHRNAQRNDYSRRKRCRCVKETQRLLEEQLPTASQEDQNSRRILRKVCGRFAEAPRKGGPVFEPKPTPAVAKHYLT